MKEQEKEKRKSKGDREYLYRVLMVKGRPSRPNLPGRVVFCRNVENGWNGNVLLEVTDLNSGTKEACAEEEVIGILLPGHLTREELLTLSVIGPEQEENEKEKGGEVFRGYALLSDGSWRDGVYLYGKDGVKEYLLMQCKYQYDVRICDRDDNLVLHMRDGERVFPTQEMCWEAEARKGW